MKKALIIALIAAPILLAMSYPGREASSGPLYVFSAIGWFGFMIAVLVVLVLSVAMVVRRATRRTPAADRA
jgi:Kef-type K+ transport system membrane component KefB